MMYFPSEQARYEAHMQAVIDADLRLIRDVILDAMINPAEALIGLPESDLPRDFIDTVAGWETPSKSAILREPQARALRAMQQGAKLWDRWLIDTAGTPLELAPVRKDVRRKFISAGWIAPALVGDVKVFEITSAGHAALANHDRSLVQFGR